MSNAPVLRRWAATGESQAFGVELAETWKRGDELLGRLEATLASGEARDARFAVCPVDDGEHVAADLTALPGRVRGVRVCVALSEDTLDRLDRETLNRLRVGLLLDNVTLDTSLRSLCTSALEAVRFEPSFLATAEGDVRVRCALTAMSALAADLGLVTLGPYPQGGIGEENSRGSLPDYVPATALALGVLRVPASALRH